MNDFDLIVAMDLNGAIGQRETNDLPWHLPGDLQHFRAVTMGRPVIMGPNTWCSLPVRPLPGRTNIVVARNGMFYPKALNFATLGDALNDMADAVVIGGATIYRLAMDLKPKVLWITIVHTESGGDVFFPVSAPIPLGADTFAHNGTVYRRVSYGTVTTDAIPYTLTRWERMDAPH
jgi:dihydrofolate reductase